MLFSCALSLVSPLSLSSMNGTRRMLNNWRMYYMLSCLRLLHAVSYWLNLQSLVTIVSPCINWTNEVLIDAQDRWSCGSKDFSLRTISETEEGWCGAMYTFNHRNVSFLIWLTCCPCKMISKRGPKSEAYDLVQPTFDDLEKTILSDCLIKHYRIKDNCRGTFMSK